MKPTNVKKLGDLLVAEGIVTSEEISEAVSHGGLKGTPLARCLDNVTHVQSSELAAFLAADYIMPRIEDLRDVTVKPDALKEIPAKTAEKHEILPIAVVGKLLFAAAGSPPPAESIREIREECGLRVKILLADPVQLKPAIARYCRGKSQDIPSPAFAEPETTVRRATPPDVEQEDMDAVPLISGDTTRRETAQAAVPVSVDDEIEELELEEVVEQVPAGANGEPQDAVRVSAKELKEERESPAVRLAMEFDYIHVTGQPVSPIRVG